MRHWRVTGAAALLLTVGMLATAGCGVTSDGRPGAAHEAAEEIAAEEIAVEAAAALGTEGQALAALGFELVGVGVPDSALAVATAAPGPTAGAAPGERAEDRRERRRARVLLRRNMLHGEVVVRAGGGTRTVTVQRGEVTAVDAESLTVRSTDGFTMRWTFGPDLRVVHRGTAIQAEQVAVGTRVGLAGAGAGDGAVARLVVVDDRD
ncbi:hypothetical protein O7627_35260 [Solwaraspora sp. WMMD1047]|uniref:hypothetical protein n=1 Tax=Solwaraspora sp. WMMD1047 TaxID=3016102 RepID=UPI002416AFC4|nr:hypothetical protein [Solwaraspora sp. WMMD1047]MDG4834529.1 hypothetical protein [Solwaraspora sp. WMMD1047]